MSLFKKPKKPVQQSRRLFTSEAEFMEIDDNEKIGKAETEIKQKKKEKSSKPQKSSLLSFGDEGI